jgi:DNA modification methylase
MMKIKNADKSLFAKTIADSDSAADNISVCQPIAKPDVTSSPGINEIIQGNCLEVLKTIPDNSIDCCVTSPPYFGLRDYGHDGQIGLEETPEEFVAKMVEVFTEVKRVLKKEGTLWLNLGDSYASDTKGSGGPSKKQLSNTGSRYEPRKFNHGLKQKDLMGIPWMVAFSLRSSGWYLRQDIIWHKPNPMPESVTDRCTKSHEYIFLMSKSGKYYYDVDAIKTPMAESSLQRLSQDVENQNGSDRVPCKTNGKMKEVGQYVGGKKHKNLQDKGLAVHTMHKTRNSNGQEWQNEDGKANKRSVWTVNTMPYSDAHFATFPERLIVDCIKAGCPENGIVLDPFMGAGTTALVARKLNRNFLGIELNEEYIKIANKRLNSELGMFR